MQMTKQWLKTQLQKNPVEDLPVSAAGDAAIAIVISHAAEPVITLCVKAAHLRTHAGEVSFPGGRRDSGDVDLLETACRELREETGLVLSSDDAVGRLSDLESLHGLRVRPWVFFAPTQLTGSPCESEIAQVLNKPLAVFRSTPPTIDVSTHRSDCRKQMPRWQFDDLVVWGLTALFIEDLLRVTGAPLAKP